MAIALFAVLSTGLTGSAQTPGAPAAETRAIQSDEDTVQHIRDLMSGKLSPDIDASSLFQRSIVGNDADGARQVLELLENPAQLEAMRRAAAAAPGDVTAAAALALAQAEFLGLPARQRTELLAKHDAKRAAAATEDAEAQDKARRLAKLEARISALEGFLDGRRVDLSTLTIDLLDPSEAALQAARRAIVLQPQPIDAPAVNDTPAEPHPGAPVEAPPTVDAQLTAAQAKVDALRARVLGLAPAERDRLREAQQAPGPDVAAAAQAAAEADLAARQAAEARLEAERASTEILKRVAYERSRMLTVRQAQAELEAQLATRGGTTDEMAELTLGLRRQVRELQSKPRTAAGRSADADSLYAELVSALQNVRSRLAVSLSDNRSQADAVLDPPNLEPDFPRDAPGGEEVLTLRQELIDGAARLRLANQSLMESNRTALFDAMTDLNETRLSLLPDLSSALRSQTVGFGQAGIEQVARELNQIGLTMRYNFASAGQQFAKTAYPFLHPTPGLVFQLLQIGLLVAVFLLWRRNGEPVLSGLQQVNAARQPPTVSSAAVGAALRIYREIRRPAEWLALLLLLRFVIGDTLQFVGDRIAWSLAIWFLLGALMVRALNGLVRNKSGDDPRAALRLRSLWLVAGVGVGAGLVLSLASDVVGAGAIYNWILSALWLLVPPIIIILANWWRDRIDTLAKAGAPKNAILAWAARNSEGFVGQITRILAGGVLVLQGVWAVIAQRMNDIAVIREIVDQRNRHAAAAKAAEDAASGRYEPISTDEADILSPHRRPLQDNPKGRAQSDRELPDLSAGTLTAFTGERGVGKTTAIQDALFAIDDALIIRLRASGDGFVKLRTDLASQLGAEDTPAGLSSALSARGVKVIVVDDVQRMIAPTIGGLNEFDRLVGFARSTGASCAWAFAVGEFSLAYLLRARSEHAIFDGITHLPRWEAADLRVLLERRTAQTGFEASFDDLVDQAAVVFGSEETPEERTRRVFFEKLSDYSAGNPAVALEFWRRSLFRNVETGRVEVRTFTRPPVDAINALPQSALFVLRTILQMDVADKTAIQQCTDFDPVIVGEMLRHLQRIGVIERVDRGYRTTLYWYREACRILERQNLLTRSAL